jgi:putative hydrolase of the HAD superfamily
MIKAVFFDFYNTLVKFWPPLDQIQQASCYEFGLNVSEEGINRGYAIADVYFNRENEINPLGTRSEAERLAFFAKYEQMILENAGLSVSLDLARQIWLMAMAVPKDFIPFDDTLPVLAELHEQGYLLGILSNLRRDMDILCQRLGLAPYLDFSISSAEVGAEKPHPAIFQAALSRLSVQASEAVHVGDQHRSDVMGARAVGIHPVLIDRGDYQSDADDCPRLSSLTELPSLLVNAPHSLSVNGRQPQGCVEGEAAE